MMELEKKLALTDLKSYHEDQKLRTFAYDIIKYQLFKGNKAVHKITEIFSKTTTISYFKAGVRYIRDGVINPRINKNLYKFIKEGLEQHIQPLTPSNSERAIIHKPHKNRMHTTTPTIKIDVPKQVTVNFQYGIRKDNTIILMPDEQSMLTFINTNKVLNSGTDIVPVTVTVDELPIS